MKCSFLWAQILIPEQPPPYPQSLAISQAYSEFPTRVKSHSSQREKWTVA